jgi:hypothetical protein
MSLKLNTASGGSISLQETNTASNFTATLPAATGDVMVSGNMPAFSVYKSNSLGTQSITANTYTKVTFDTEDFDTNSNFASSRFTPTVAGYYQINGEIDLGGLGSLLIGIFKNGSEYKRGTGTTSGTESYLSVSTIVYMNGSTDYVEVYALSSGAGGSVYATAAGQYTWFNGCLVRAA